MLKFIKNFVKKFLLSLFKISEFFCTKSLSGAQSMKAQVIQESRIAELTPMERRQLIFEINDQLKQLVSEICSLTELFCYSLKSFEKYDSRSNEHLLQISTQSFGLFAEISKFLISEPLDDNSKQLDELALRYGQIKEHINAFLESLKFQSEYDHYDKDPNFYQISLERLQKFLTQSFPSAIVDAQSVFSFFEKAILNSESFEKIMAEHFKEYSKISTENEITRRIRALRSYETSEGITEPRIYDESIRNSTQRGKTFFQDVNQSKKFFEMLDRRYEKIKKRSNSELEELLQYMNQPKTTKSKRTCRRGTGSAGRR